VRGTSRPWIARIHLVHQTPLLEVVLATGTARRFAGTRECRQQDCRQNADDRNHDQQLDECETLFLHPMIPYVLLPDNQAAIHLSQHPASCTLRLRKDVKVRYAMGALSAV
jgi:hypothetical protein